MKVRFKSDNDGLLAILNSKAVQDMTYAKAESIAKTANAMASRGPGHEEPYPSAPAYTANRGKNAKMGISNVATCSRHGVNDNAAHHTLQKAGGV